jgi:hypothetical protein
MIFSKRRAYNGRLTIGRLKEGLPLVGFKYRKADDWLDLNSKQEGVRLVGFKYQKGYDWLDLNSKQEGVRLVGFKYQKGYDWLDSQFHCSYLESRGVPGKTREIPGKRGKLSPFHFRFKTSGEVISGDATSGDVISGDATSGRTCARDHFRHHHTAPPQLLTELSPYTTTVLYNRHCTRRCTI